MDWPTYLARGVTGVVTPAALEALYDRGFVVLDGVLGATHAGAVAADAEAMSASAELSSAAQTPGGAGASGAIIGRVGCRRLTDRTSP